MNVVWKWDSDKTTYISLNVISIFYVINCEGKGKYVELSYNFFQLEK